VTPMSAAPAKTAPKRADLSGAERHALDKESKSLDRQIQRLKASMERFTRRWRLTDQSDYEGLAGSAAASLGLRRQTSMRSNLGGLDVADKLRRVTAAPPGFEPRPNISKGCRAAITLRGIAPKGSSILPDFGDTGRFGGRARVPSARMVI